MNVTVKAKVELQEKKLKKSAELGMQTGLKGAAAHLWSHIRRKIRRRKHKSSRPGTPPYDHSHYKRAIKYKVVEKDMVAYIGPERWLSQPENPSGPVPHTLEFGGRTRTQVNKAWFVRKTKYMIGNSFGSVANYFMTVGYGPLFMGESESAVIAQAQRKQGGKIGAWRDRIRTKKNMVTGKTIFYLSVPMRSQKQAYKAAQLTVKHFGYPRIVNAVIAPRPVMGPTLEESRAELAQYFQDTITQ